MKAVPKLVIRPVSDWIPRGLDVQLAMVIEDKMRRPVKRAIWMRVVGSMWRIMHQSAKMEVLPGRYFVRTT